MRFPKYGQFSLDISGNVMEVFATGAWNRQTTENMIEEMRALTPRFNGEPWAALMDARRWILATPDSQTLLTQMVRQNVQVGLRRAAYVLDSGMVKKAQLERTHPGIAYPEECTDYQRQYFPNYFAALRWLNEEGYSPIIPTP